MKNQNIKMTAGEMEVTDLKGHIHTIYFGYDPEFKSWTANISFSSSMTDPAANMDEAAASLSDRIAHFLAALMGGNNPV